MRFAAIAALALSPLAAASSASAITLNFSDLSSGSCAIQGASVNSGGFSFVDGYNNANGLYMCNANIVANNSTPALLDNSNPSLITMSQIGGASFSLQSFFASGRENYSPATGIDIVGTLASGSTISDIITFTDSQFSQYVLPAGFTGLSSVTFTATGKGQFLFNDIVVNAAVVPAEVPEPTTLALFGAGLLGLGLLGRRANAAAV